MLNIVILSKSHLKKLKEYKLALILTIAVVFTSFSQNPVGIGTVEPHPSAILEVSSTNKGFLPPRMSEDQMGAITSPAGGLIVYCTNCDPKGVYISNGGSGFSMPSPPPAPPVEYLNIDDVRIVIGTTYFDISPTLIPSGATVEYKLIRKPTEEVTISGTRINNIPPNLIIGEEYNITVKARGNGDYSGVTGATFKLNVVSPPQSTKAMCFRFSSGTITDYIFCPFVDVVIPDSIRGVTVRVIQREAFRENNLSSIYIPNSVTSIGDFAFYNNNLTSVYIGDSVTSIGESAFYENNLTSVTIPNSVTSIGNAAFAENSLTSVTIPNSVTSIENSAFRKNSLTSVYIPDSVTSIGYKAFYDNNITSVTIPDSVTSIGDWAFAGNNSITSVSIKEGTIYTASGEKPSFGSSCTVASGCITIRP